MFRFSFIIAVASATLTGCTGTWDTLTSRRMREHPIETTKRMIVPEDPVAVLLADPPRTGDQRAAAMRRLKPERTGRDPEAQSAILAVLERAATTDPSPVLRMEAIAALGRFQDPRAASILITAYQNAHGRHADEPAPPPMTPSGVVTAGLSAGRSPTTGLTDPFSTMTGPTGYPPEWVTAIRCRTAESLGKTNQPEAAKFLAVVAGADRADVTIEGREERDIRLAALCGLGHCRQQESVVALARVLETEAGKKDTAIIGWTHEGLVHLTGKKLPPDPRAWNGVVQAGVVIVPEPAWWENAIEQVGGWVK